MYKLRLVLGVIVVLGFVNSSIGQQQNLQNFTSRNGLADQIVNAAFQDQDGYIWFATQSGVSIYNGNSFTDFIPSDELKGVDAVTVTQTSEGDIWIGTNSNGVFKYDYSKLTHYTTKNGLPSEVIRSFFIDQNNKVWVATDKGVAYFKNGKWTKFVDPSRVLNNGVLSITQTSDGKFWFGTQGKGLVRYENSKFEYFENVVDDPYIFSLKTIGNTLYIGTTSQGLYSYSQGNFTKIVNENLDQSWISNILEIEDGIAVVSSNGLVKIGRTGKTAHITEENGIASDDLYNGLYDREQNIWLTSGNGVTCLRREEIISFDESSGLSDEKITSLLTLTNGNIVVGLYGQGLNILDANGNVIKQYNPEELSNLMITSILEVPSRQELWIGLNLADVGILVLDLKNNSLAVKRKISQIKGIPVKNITKLERSSTNDIWIGSYTNGLFKLSAKDTLIFSTKNGLPSNAVYTFTLNEADQPIVSLYQKGAYLWTGTKFQSLNTAYRLKEKFVQSIACARNGTIYLGNKTEGLTVIYPSGKVQQLSTKNGLLSNFIQSILIDQQTIWCGTDKGLNKITFSKEKLSKIVIYTEKSGLINTEIQQNALQFNGRYLWVGSSTGISRINLDIERSSDFKPLIELQSIKLFFEDVDWKKKKGVKSFTKHGIPSQLELAYTDNHLTFEFNAITTRPVKYAYFLEGSDNDWTPFLDAKEATYSNLAPGSYTFMVKSLDYFGEVSEIFEIQVIIRPPFWQTWWFRIGAILLGVILLVWFVKWRERNFRERQQTLQSMVDVRTKEAVEASKRAEEQRQLVEHKNKEIVDSIEYAKRIQSAMLPTLDSVQKGFPASYIFYQPKDIVAGDFYWYLELDGQKFIAVADCTGHGVPGALMSVVCYNALNRAVREYGKRVTGEILDRTREIILDELAKSDQDMRDGMDISLLMIDEKNRKVQWSGANTPLWMISKNTDELTEIKGDKQPIGQHIHYSNYTSQNMEYELETTFVLFSDGYSDQFGGEHGKKFKSPNFKKLLLELRSLETLEIGERVKEQFQTWKGNHEQVDDVCVLLIRI